MELLGHLRQEPRELIVTVSRPAGQTVPSSYALFLVRSRGQDRTQPAQGSQVTHAGGRLAQSQSLLRSLNW